MIDVRGSKALDRYRWLWPEWLPLPCVVAVYFLFPNYLVFAASVMVMALFAMSLDLIIGFAGVLTLGHGVFFGLGAYGAGLLALAGLHEPVVNAICGAAFAAAVAALIGPFILKLSGLRLIMVTLGIASIALEAANKANWLTGGHDGLQNIVIAPVLGRFEWTLDGTTAYVYVAVWLALALVALRFVVASPFGLALQGVRENETRMLVMGAPVQTQLCVAFALSAFVAGLAGALSAQTNAFVSLDVLSLDLSIYALAMLVLGGIGRLYGALLGAAIYMSVQYFTQELNPTYWMFAVGALLILVVRFGRGGLLGVFEAIIRRIIVRKAPGTKPAALEIRNLTKRFGGLQVTNDVSLSLETGARHALIGPNGAGKSTLVGLISGVIRPNGGTVSLFGEDVTSAKPARRTKLGLVRTFQITSLFAELTVLENLYLAVSEQRGESLAMWRPAAMRGETLSAAEVLLTQFKLTAFANRTVSQLAYGQQRLIEIALALALHPKVLLLDEPAAGIPSGETRLLMDAIEALPAEISILMIEHDMALVKRFAKDATLLVRGAVAATGPIGELMASETVRQVYLGKAAEARMAPHA